MCRHRYVKSRLPGPDGYTTKFKFEFRLHSPLSRLCFKTKQHICTKVNGWVRQSLTYLLTASIDGLVSSWSENIFVSFCLRAPRCGLTLWSVLGLLVGGASSVSTSRSRDGLETYQRLVSVSSREKLSTSLSRFSLGRQTSRSSRGLELLRLVPILACTAMVSVH